VSNKQLVRMGQMLEALCVAWGVEIPPLPTVPKKNGKLTPVQRKRKKLSENRTYEPWSPQDDKVLTDMRKKGIPHKACGRVLHRTTAACSVRWSVLNRSQQ